MLDVRCSYRPDDRTVLIGHDWGAQAGYGVVAAEPSAFARFVALAVPPIAALATAMFSYAQLKRSFYIWFIQQVGLAEAALVAPGFWESLWADWSPGYDPTEDIAELRRYLSAENIANDGAIGADLLDDLGPHLPASGSAAEIVDGVGHFLHLEQPDLVAAKIGDWLGTQS
jgi:pimeloyl-ACP methyl ester carboxylesterase